MVFLFRGSGNCFYWVEVACEEVDGPNHAEGALVAHITFAGITSTVVGCHLEVRGRSIRP